jgi:hypothetical protein
MGRLTLNVLLSFAQFEREVTGERIRDKIAASKKKGLWMGGPVPLGYDVRDKRLIINPQEAETVRTLFRLYRELGTVRRLKEAVEQRGLMTKRRGDAPGKPFTRGHLYQLLGNALYVGEVAHRGVTHPGQHDAIIDRSTWEAVQSQLKANRAAERSKKNVKTISPLAGLLYDETGDRLCPTHANKRGRRYRYYISQRLVHDAHKQTDGWRLPAKEIEMVVTGALAGYLKDSLQLIDNLGLVGVSPDVTEAVVQKASSTANIIINSDLAVQRGLLEKLVSRVTLAPTAIVIDIRRAALARYVLGHETKQRSAHDEQIALSVPVCLKRRGVETKLVIRSADPRLAAPDRNLISLVAQAHQWIETLATGDSEGVQEIAKRDGIDPSDVGRILQLAFLAPDIVDAILAGRQPIDLTAKRLKRIGTLPMDWDSQRRVLGFSA